MHDVDITLLRERVAVRGSVPRRDRDGYASGPDDGQYVNCNRRRRRRDGFRSVQCSINFIFIKTPPPCARSLSSTNTHTHTHTYLRHVYRVYLPAPADETSTNHDSRTNHIHKHQTYMVKRYPTIRFTGNSRAYVYIFVFVFSTADGSTRPSSPFPSASRNTAVCRTFCIFPYLSHRIPPRITR